MSTRRPRIAKSRSSTRWRMPNYASASRRTEASKVTATSTSEPSPASPRAEERKPPHAHALEFAAVRAQAGKEL